MRARDGRAHRPAHRAEDAEPPAMDLVVVRAGGRRAAEVGRLAGGVRAERRAAARRCRSRIRCRSRRWRPSRCGRTTWCASRDAPILTATELTSYGYQHLLAGTPWQYYRLIVTQWPRLEGNQADPIPARVDGSVAEHVPRHRRVLGVRERHDGDVRSEGRAARVHELPQPRAHDRRTSCGACSITRIRRASAPAPAAMTGRLPSTSRSCANSSTGARRSSSTSTPRAQRAREGHVARQRSSHFEQILDSCFFDAPGLPRDLSRLKGATGGRAPGGWLRADRARRLLRTSSIRWSSSLAPMQHWERHRWPGRNVRLPYAAARLLRLHPSPARASEPADLG